MKPYASLADARARGSYMGFSRLGLAIGGAIGYIGGGWLFDWANRRTSQSFRG